MDCRIEWMSEGYEARLKDAARGNLLQSRLYAQAVCPLYGQTARSGLIMINGREAGLVQIQEAGILKNLVHALILDRGPLWFDGFGTPDHAEAFFAHFAALFPRRFLRRRRIIPEIADLEGNRAMMRRHGYTRVPARGYETAYIDLRREVDVLRARLKKNFRGALSKAEASRLTVEWEDPALHAPWFIATYAQDKAARGYAGASLKTLSTLAARFVGADNLMIGRALLDNVPVASILILCHGSAATYQAGWTLDEGRAHSAHHLLLWNAFLQLKHRRVDWFDLGGMNDDTAKGVKQFKEGLGGDLLTLAGQYY